MLKPALTLPPLPPAPTPTPKLKPNPLEEKSSSVCFDSMLRLLPMFKAMLLANKLAPEMLASLPVVKFKLPFSALTCEFV
jgi:hypothetical protein